MSLCSFPFCCRSAYVHFTHKNNREKFAFKGLSQSNWIRTGYIPNWYIVMFHIKYSPSEYGKFGRMLNVPDSVHFRIGVAVAAAVVVAETVRCVWIYYPAIAFGSFAPQHTFQVAAESVFTTVATGRFVFGCMSHALEMRKISSLFLVGSCFGGLLAIFSSLLRFFRKITIFSIFSKFYATSSPTTHFFFCPRINVELFGKSMTISVARSQFISTHQRTMWINGTERENAQEQTKKTNLS